ncbi:MAG: 2-oxoglutarate dehydrogenase, E2 component, dihydrolipoamide succinyltransferase [Acidimicrobiia bacterium]|nr:2-oxoglutarate dehydrogenase, E2 component, dihydrolipoamide succinyltransferase [Acidimicrobiia bacterium]
MATTVSMPQLGETVTEGTILSWPKKVGDTIAVDEVLVEISTDKVDTEIPSPVGGVILDILVPEGETVVVGTDLIVIGEAGEEPATPAAPQAEPAAVVAEPAPAPMVPPEPSPVAEPSAATPETAPQPAPAAPVVVESTEGLFLSPVVRKLAREHNLDLSSVTGTGRDGRITRKDVEALIETGVAQVPTTPSEAPVTPQVAPVAAVSPAAPAAAEPAAVEPADIPLLEGDEVRDLDRLRVRIGENMIHAKQTAAHVWTSVEVDYTRVERIRQAHKAEFKEAEGFSLTYLPFIARATMDALKAFPVVNSSFYLEQKKAVFHRTVNLGIAVDMDQKGLLVASIRDADGLRLVGLARRIRDIAVRGRAGELGLDDITGSTFSITNPGPFGSFMSAPIINVPNTGILSTETVVKRPTVITGPDGADMIAIRHIGYLGLTWDHRAFDGSTAVLFLRRIKENLETWDWEQELA